MKLTTARNESFQTTSEHLASIYHMDREMKKIVAAAEKLDRETIFIVQSDNGGAVHKFGSNGGSPDRSGN